MSGRDRVSEIIWVLTCAAILVIAVPPLTIPAICLLILWAIWAYRRWLRKITAMKRRERGQCPFCGYDIRATPDRCPECGSNPFLAVQHTSLFRRAGRALGRIVR